MFQTIKNAWHIEDTRRKIIYTLFIIVLYRIGCAIPVPYVDSEAWASTFDNAGETIFGYLNILSGASFSQGTLFALSITPYITSSIVMQLLTIAIPPLERLSKQPDGQKKITQITRYVTVILAVITAFGYYLTMKNQGALTNEDVFPGFVIIACYVAGASLIMWLGEKINDKGIGNGISIILFFNIVSRAGALISAARSIIGFSGLGWLWVILAAVIMLAVITFVVWMTNSERRLPVQYAKRTVGRKMYGGMNTHLPIKLNMSGVMPIIFAQSIVSLPSTLALIFGWDTTKGILSFLSMTGPIGIALNFLLIIGFSYFYLTISFNPVEVANNLKKNGGTVLGYRPGAPTAAYIQKVLGRITLIGALFLAFIAIFPQLIYLLFPSTNMGALVFGGSSLIILVGVVLETIKELESEVTMRHYKGFLD